MISYTFVGLSFISSSVTESVSSVEQYDFAILLCDHMDVSLSRELFSHVSLIICYDDFIHVVAPYDR